jgi:hypothetical protein
MVRLFEIDHYLNKETKGNFVRWMDDIDFAVRDIESAKKILRSLLLKFFRKINQKFKGYGVSLIMHLIFVYRQTNKIICQPGYKFSSLSNL